jgi:HK97 family phage major capsid protein
MAEEKTADQLVAEVKTLVAEKHDAVKAIADEALGKAKAGETLTNATKEIADEALSGLNEAKSRLDTLEQKMARNGGNGEGEEAKSIGQMVVDSDEVKSFLDGTRKGRVSVDVKAIISALATDANGSAGDLIVPQRQPGILGLPERRMTVRDLLTPGNTTSNAIQYVKETGFTNNAATVSETAGTTKPQSEIKFDLVTTAVTTVAHWVLATRQILDDVPQLQSYIDGRLRFGLAYAEELQLLLGGGSGTDLNGVYTQATAFSAPTTLQAPTNIDVLRLAMLQAVLAEYPATGIVMHPTDWATIELVKDTTGRHIIGNPAAGGTNRTLWGLPVVETPAMTVDKFLVGAFRLGAQIFDRQDANVEISTEDSDNFRKNLVTIRAEERLALAVYRPEAFIKGDFSDSVAAATGA